MAVPPPVMGGHQQQQQSAQNAQGTTHTHIASLGQHQASIMPQIQTQVVNQQQQHQLPLSVTPVSYSTIQSQQQQLIQQQAIQTVSSILNIFHNYLMNSCLFSNVLEKFRKRSTYAVCYPYYSYNTSEWCHSTYAGIYDSSCTSYTSKYLNYFE